MAGFIVKLVAFAALLFVLLELSARVVIFGPSGLDPRKVGVFQDRTPSSLVTFETDPRVLFEYRPNLDVFFKLVRFRTNSVGMRDQEYALAKPPNTFRVAVVGSSFTVPIGTEIEDAYHSLLEERFKRDFAPTTYEFLNFAIFLHAPSQVLATLHHKALRYDPDLILFAVTSMAAPRLLEKWDRVPPPKKLQVIPVGLRSYFVKLVRSRLGLGRAVGFKTPEFPKALAGEEDVISELARVGRELDVPVVVVRVELDNPEATPLEDAVEEKVWAEGMFYVDTRSPFRGIHPRDKWIYELDPHPNAAAHAIIAEVVAKAFEDYDLLPNRLSTE
jgi:hypothetical protein